MYSAKLVITRGIGKEYRVVKADSYKDLQYKVNDAIDYLSNYTTYLLGKYVTYTVQEIVYSYPSGKTYRQFL